MHKALIKKVNRQSLKFLQYLETENYYQNLKNSDCNFTSSTEELGKFVQLRVKIFLLIVYKIVQHHMMLLCY